jgi:tetratricopeptide (TPR) repeat protein
VAALLGPAPPARAQDVATQQLLDQADRYYDAGDYDRAADAYDRAIGGQPKTVPASAFAKRASIYLFRKQYDQGLAWIARVAEPVWPDDDAILEQKAVMLSRMPDRQRDSVALAERVVKRRPAQVTLQILLGDHYFAQGSGAADKTVGHYEAYLKNRPPDLSGKDGLVHVKLGFSYLYLARYPDAERQFDDAVRSFAQDSNIGANARKGLCAAYAGEKNWDKALTLCERVIKDRKAMRGDPSPHYNAGLAYLNRDRLEEALKSADIYLQAKPKEAKGYLLRGEVYFRQNRFAEAEAQYNTAEQLAPGDGDVARELGRVYLKQRRPAKAIEKLSRAIAANPRDIDTCATLAEAFLAEGQGAQAATQAQKGLKIPGQEKNTRLMGLEAEGYYLAGQLAPARQTLELALATARTAGQGVDARQRTLLVDTINRQAAARFQADDTAGADKLLLEAREVDPESVRTNFNLGLVAVEKGRWEEALKYLQVRLGRSPGDLLTNRVAAKAYLNLGNGDKAGEHYARAAAEASRLHNLAVLAEIYTEWAPLLVKAGKLEEAVAALEQAAAGAQGQPFEKATRRNLQLLYFRRGYERLRAHRAAEAAADLENATREPALLQGTEEDAFSFALGLAYLDSGQAARAVPIFQGMARRAGAAAFLKPPFDSVGLDLFTAYAYYRDASAASRARAQPLLDRLAARTGGALSARVREMLRSSWEMDALDAWLRGDVRGADLALKRAAALAPPDKRPIIDHNQAALDLERAPGAAKTAFQRLSEKIPEALINLGIIAEREGDPRGAYDYWVQARAHGARGGRLDEWIDAKKRLFGF